MKGTFRNDYATCMELTRTEQCCTTPRAMDSVKDFIEHFMTCCVHFLQKKKKRKWPHLPQVLYVYNTTKHQSTGYSPYELMFGQKAQLPVDFLLGGAQEEFMSRSVKDWVDEHQKQLSSVYLHVKDQLQQAAEQRNRHYQPTATFILTPGTSVYRSHPTERHKIQDAWDPIVYVVVENMDEEGRVYKIRPRDVAGPEKNLNRSELKVVPTANISMPIVYISVC